MTFITRIDTPSTDLIRFNDVTAVDKIIDSTSTTLAVSGTLNVTLLAPLVVTNNLVFNGIITGSSPFRIFLNPAVTTTGYIDFNSIARLNLANGFLGIKTGTTPVSFPLEMGTNTATIFQGNTNLSDGRFYFDSVNARIGINTTSPTSTLTVNTNTINYENSPLIIASVGAVGINNTTPSNSTVVHTLAGTGIANAIYDENSFLVIEDSGRAIVQIISGNNKSGIIFSAVPSTTNKHWIIAPSWDVAPAFTTTGGGAAFDNAPSINDLYFCYLASSTTTPVATAFATSTAIKGYLQFDVAVGIINFTGQHICNPESGSIADYDDKIGLIVVSSGIYCETVDINDLSGTTITINESIPKVRLSSKRYDKSVFGVISGKDEMEEKRKYSDGRFVTLYDKKPGDHRLVINSVGEGAIWVTNINGNFENGDYITSCEIPGYGMRQESEDLYNYTVAKITCDCDFDLSSSVYQCEEFQFSGSIYRRAFVGCTYHCG